MPMPPPPTDRLHKFLAIGGLTLVLAGITTAIQKYEEAEVQRIEAIAKTRIAVASIQDYADRVDRMAAIQRDAFAKNLQGKELQDAKAKFFEVNTDAEKLQREYEQQIVEGQKQIQLALYRSSIRNLWFGLSFAGIALGIVAAWAGFRQWLRQPKDTR